MRVVFVALIALMALPACDRLMPDRALRTKHVEFDGLRFKAKADDVSEDKRDFTITVQNVSRNIPAALEAGNFEAVKYCLGLFGGSDAEWTTGPDQDPETVSVSENDTLTLSGRCTKR